MIDSTPEWVYIPLGLLALALFVFTFWLLGLSDKADKAGVPKSKTLVVTRTLVLVSWIVAPLLGIFDPDGEFWRWVGRVSSSAALASYPFWITAEVRRGTIRMQSGSGSQHPRKVDGSGV